MNFPISWLKDFVDIELPIPELAHRLTLAGLEVEHIRFVGLPLPQSNMEKNGAFTEVLDTNASGLAWDPEKIVVGAIHEVMPHPNADRLVLCRLDDGQGEHTVLTGAPNLFPYKEAGPLDPPLKVAYAREGARIYDGHQPGFHEMTLKRATIRGVESSSMVCSEKELGISEEHEGVIILDADAPIGVSLVEYMGDAVLEIAITPNIARDANILGVAREVAALTGARLREPDLELAPGGSAIEGKVSIEIRQPEMNPRFVLGMIEGIALGPSPYWVQRRLQLAGMRPINNIVDATNYAMLEIGEPLHAFDYDVLLERAGGKPPTIITRFAERGERLMTLDGVERELDEFTILVADTAGVLSIAGVMGGLESEVTEKTARVLLEGAAWNFINIRQTLASQNLHSEASYRFERGVHPAQAERGVRRGLSLMAELAGGELAAGLVDVYPLPPKTPTITLTPADVQRWLGIELGLEEIAALLASLQFAVRQEEGELLVTPPDHRLDIGQGVIGLADLMEEIARIFGYDRIPETMMADALPQPRHDRSREVEERVRDLLVNLGLQEVITYRMTTSERERRILPAAVGSDDRPYITIENPISTERVVMRHSLLASVLEIVESNARFRDRLAVFELAPVYLVSEGGEPSQEPLKLVVVMTGPNGQVAWDEAPQRNADFFDLKGMLQALLEGLGVEGAGFKPHEHPAFHPGKCAALICADRKLGVIGELHPLVKANFTFPAAPVLATEIDFQALLASVPEHSSIASVSAFPPVLEDLALVVPEVVPASEVEAEIRQAGGRLLTEVRLFDLYQGDQIGQGTKSLAYSLVYQASDRTLTDDEVAKVRNKIIERVERELGGELRA
jgi:phenylalanyl-tRNA synthetase beta chain